MGCGASALPKAQPVDADGAFGFPGEAKSPPPLPTSAPQPPAGNELAPSGNKLRPSGIRFPAKLHAFHLLSYRSPCFPRSAPQPPAAPPPKLIQKIETVAGQDGAVLVKQLAKALKAEEVRRRHGGDHGFLQDIISDWFPH